MATIRSKPTSVSPSKRNMRLRVAPTSATAEDGYMEFISSPNLVNSSFDSETTAILGEEDGTHHHDVMDVDSDACNGAEAVSPVNKTKSILNVLKEEAPPTSIFLLNLVAVIWGSQHAVIKLVVEDSQASLFTFLRFSLAAILASPYTPGLSTLWDQQKTQSVSKSRSETSSPTSVRTAWRWGLEMGFWMFLGFSFQAIGLGDTSAQRSGFLLYLNVKLVPLFARVLFGRSISVPTWVSAATAFLGTSLLALDGSGEIGLNVGDVWSIAAAASSAMFILRLEQASQKVTESSQLNAACLWVVAGLAGIWSLLSPASTTDPLFSQLVGIASAHPLELLYLGGVSTALANYIQTKAQQDVTAERASVIYSLDPVYGAIFSYIILGETLGGPQAYIGAGLITVAAATNVFLDLGGTAKKETNGTDCNSVIRQDV